MSFYIREILFKPQKLVKRLGYISYYEGFCSLKLKPKTILKTFRVSGREYFSSSSFGTKKILKLEKVKKKF